ncbi:MAG: HAMP domain-containing protein [Alphaproteobacteria bacterium]|nr:HAMP domain-containing protein [Alphaproteobacteria bacterium]
MRFNLRTKMMLFAAIIAALPLVVAGQSIIRIAQDELKSTANEQLASAASQLTDEFNAFFEYSLMAPLDLIRNAIGGDELGSKGKIALVRQGIEDLPDVVALQIDIEGVPRPLMVTQEAYFTRLKEHFPDPLEVLRITSDEIEPGSRSQRSVQRIHFVEETGDWLATATLPIEGGISGRQAVLHARINLERLRQDILDHPFAQTGQIHVMDAEGTIVFGTTDTGYDHESVMDAAGDMLSRGTATIAVGPFELADGAISLAAIAVPRAFPWAVLVEKSEKDAYQPVTDMIRNLATWLGIGLIVAMVGALLFSMRISGPILKIGQAAIQIAKGNLDVRVDDVRSHDEIGDLATRFNDMIVQLNERFELQKFVSRGTMQAIESTDGQEVSLGGERRRVAILFADIRGYTAFSEGREPEEVVAVLNSYFQTISDIVADNHGDIDKFVGDEIMALFVGSNMTKHAVECAIAIMNAMKKMTTESGVNLRIGIGIHVGEVVFGAMGSSQRKDFTVLGDHVNLAARLCSAAGPDETFVTRDVIDDLPEKLVEEAESLEPISVKGKTKPIEIFVYHGPAKADLEAV